MEYNINQIVAVIILEINWINYRQIHFSILKKLNHKHN